MRSIVIIGSFVLLGMNLSFSQSMTSIAPAPNVPNSKNVMKNSIHDFKVTDISGNEFDFKSLKGKKVIVVNTASECGYTPQYADLEKLYKKYSDKLVIVGFPSNDFGKQEPGSDKEIATFCQKNYGVTFPMMSKISVTGDRMHPIYHFLTNKGLNGLQNSTVEWNFQKYLIDEEGNLVQVLDSKVNPMDQSIVSWVKGDKK